MSEVQEAVDELMSTINAEIACGNLPSMDEMVSNLLIHYAEFTHAILDSTSMSEVDEAIQEYPEAVEFNNHVQFYVALEDRGLMELNPSENVRPHVYNQIIRYVAQEAVAKTFAHPMVRFDDFEESLKRIVKGVAVNHLLKPTRSLPDPEILNPDKYPLVHPKSSTMH